MAPATPPSPPSPTYPSSLSPIYPLHRNITNHHPLQRMKVAQIEKTDVQLLNLLEMVESVEFEMNQLQVFEGLKAGNKALEEIHRTMSGEATVKALYPSLCHLHRSVNLPGITLHTALRHLTLNIININGPPPPTHLHTYTQWKAFNL